ncbi:MULTISPECIES: hypothetical protein [unclassified Sulfitobacter]|uniref:hypothetical protein n=1 Tax=unclassified Sulfitobacter TaxID=196795 RepID=UPI0007C27429|nr:MULTISPECIES: hypothetical protein [unclassified Sulfitobacter]KZY05246.1 hypothetical protein A3721_15045 [Sulfitobacter sp. HI0023]KZY25594.1 hypothetical protein A3728_18470 [Sulfitobacter sp. HI0040]KZZ68856.1 hypothetical protein A3764_12160 [Sulfitobacter sp. HI0129]
MKLVSSIKGVRIDREIRDGCHVLIQLMECHTCEEVAKFGPSHQGSAFPEEFIFKKARQIGWLPKKNGRHSCPNCQEVHKVPDEAPREMTIPERRKIFREIDENYDEANSRYVDKATDNTIAVKLGVPRKWVEDIRAENFGPSGVNTEMERVASAIARITAQLTDAINDCMEAAAKAEDLKKEADEARGTLEQIKKSVGPRRVA